MIETRYVDLDGFGSRRYRIYIPPGSEGPKPLLLLFDGQNVFDDDGSFSGGWYAHEAIAKLGVRRPRPILVGLDHGGETRINELSPFPTRFGSGRADQFLDAIVRQLLPSLRADLPLWEGPAGALIGGSSMGGLASFYAHFRHPDIFGGALAMSPSFALGGKRLFQFIERAPMPSISKIYLDMGAREGTAKFEEMVRLLRSAGYNAAHLRVRIDPRGSHNERAWRRRLPAALRFFYTA